MKRLYLTRLIPNFDSNPIHCIAFLWFGFVCRMEEKTNWINEKRITVCIRWFSPNFSHVFFLRFTFYVAWVIAQRSPSINGNDHSERERERQRERLYMEILLLRCIYRVNYKKKIWWCIKCEWSGCSEGWYFWKTMQRQIEKPTWTTRHFISLQILHSEWFWHCWANPQIQYPKVNIASVKA